MAILARDRASDRSLGSPPRPSAQLKERVLLPARYPIECPTGDRPGDTSGKPKPQLSQIRHLIAGLSPAEQRALASEFAVGLGKTQIDTSQPRTAAGLARAKVKQPDKALVQSDDSDYVAVMFRDGPGRAPIADVMPEREISAKTAAEYGLDQDEAHLALLYAAASKEATQHALTATPDEAKRMSNVARMWSLSLDLCQRLKVAIGLPTVMKDEREIRFGGRLAATFQELRKLEKILFGEPRTRINPLITKTKTSLKAHERTVATVEPKAPATQGSVSKDPSHLAA